MAPTYAGSALATLEAGDVRSAYKKAVHACQMRPNPEALQSLGWVFYAHGKLLASEGRLREASADFSKAVRCTADSSMFRLRTRTTEKALRHPSRGKVQHRLDVRSFCGHMSARMNLSLSDLPPAAFLHVVRKAGYLYPPSVRLRQASHLDGFCALGTYRWQGDEKSSDQFTQWIRRLKNGDRTVGVHLGQLLADWVLAETSVLRDADLLVAVPGDTQRQAQRGFNPPDALAEAIRDRVGIPILEGVLTRSESRRARDSSFGEVQAGFRRGKQGARVKGWSVVLVDDVATQGSTLRACSKHLHDAGAKRVVCVVLAQAITTHREREASGSPTVFSP